MSFSKGVRLKRSLSSITFIIAATILLWASNVQGQPSGKEYIVRKVVDGDTIELSNGRRVRYIGVDTPETMKRQGGEWYYDPEEFSREAKKMNKALTSGKKVRLEYDVIKEDKYDRLLAYVYVGEIMVNAELIRNGLAMTFTIPPNDKYLDNLLKAQKEARIHKRGLWKKMPQVASGDAKEYIGKYVSVKGTVKRINISRGKTYLTLGSSREKYLTIVIYNNNIPIFHKNGIDPSSDYRNRLIEVVGKVKNRKGPQIVVDSPAQILILR